jgi:hypothetical protein
VTEKDGKYWCQDHGLPARIVAGCVLCSLGVGVVAPHHWEFVSSIPAVMPPAPLAPFHEDTGPHAEHRGRPPASSAHVTTTTSTGTLFNAFSWGTVPGKPDRVIIYRGQAR